VRPAGSDGKFAEEEIFGQGGKIDINLFKPRRKKETWEGGKGKLTNEEEEGLQTVQGCVDVVSTFRKDGKREKKHQKKIEDHKVERNLDERTNHTGEGKTKEGGVNTRGRKKNELRIVVGKEVLVGKKAPYLTKKTSQTCRKLKKNAKNRGSSKNNTTPPSTPWEKAGKDDCREKSRKKKASSSDTGKYWGVR